jgi:cytochrome c oxidase assembly protein subunit 11
MTPQQRTASRLAAVAGLMLSLSFAAVPFYDWFCKVTGFAGTTTVATTPSDTVLDQTVLVRFDASVEAGMPWEFRPMQRTMRIRIGETGLAFYEAYNPTGQAVAGTASYNVTPDAAGYYFSKIACFCFEQQVLQAGERVEMPVSFYIDPDMVTDRDGRFVREITLSYTFHRSDLPLTQAARVPADAGATN